MDVQEFWLVWCLNGGTPTVPHWTEESARAEAERLALAHKGRTFVVLKSIAACQCHTVNWWLTRPANSPEAKCGEREESGQIWATGWAKAEATRTKSDSLHDSDTPF